MSFGQPSGPPASAKQVRDLLALLELVGYDGFRSARGPLGFSQRQGNGKFTRDEAEALIEQLQAELDGAPPHSPAGAEPVPPEPPVKAPSARATTRAAGADQVLRRFSSQQLAAELQRRGWVVMEP